MSAACPNCGTPNRPGAKFCGTCGATLSGAPQEATVTAPHSPATTERRVVSIMFVDLVGFTPFAEERDAEAVRETLDRYFDMARLAVERHGGVIEKFIGDAVMAVWGTPTAHEDDAERAVRAAFEVLDGGRSLGAGIEARAGVVTGEAAVTLGAEGQGMVAGDLVNTASRLQSVAPPGAVLTNEANRHAAQAAIAFEPAGPQELKGKKAPVEAFRAVRVLASRGGHNRTEALEPPFVGREEELRLLKEALHATTRDQRVRLVSITGPAGIGKSRLAWELEKYVDGIVERVYWHHGRSPSYGEGVTFWALGEMVRRRAALAESDDEATTRSRVAEAVAEFVPDAEERSWVEHALLALLGVEEAPPGGRDALFAAWRIFFERVSESATTVLVFEDLQWADGGLLDFIEHLLDWSKNHPILVVGLTRPELYERRPGWGGGHRLVTSISLEPLAEQAMRDLLAGLVPGLPDEAAKAILRRADGIPLYAVETVRMLVSEGRLEQADGVYRPTGQLNELAVPETLRSLIASRLDALEPARRSVLQDAAILGQRFTLPVLAQVSGMADDQLEEHLRALVAREILDVDIDPRSPERGQYGFVQSLIREVAYATLSRAERRTRHLAAARYFEALGDDELAGVLANHYVAAHDASSPGPEADALAAQARIALRAAGERAAELGAHDQAVTYFEQAMAVAAGDADQAELLELAAVSANIAGHEDVAERYATQAAEAHASTGDEDALARVSAQLGRILIDAGHLPRAIEVMRNALDRAKASATAPMTARLLATLSRAYMRSNDAEPAIAAADAALDLAEPLNLDQVVAEAFVNKGSALQMGRGRRREAAVLLEKAVGIAHAGGWSDIELRATNNLSVALFEDDPRRGRDVAQGGVALARRLGHRIIDAFQTGTVGMYSHAIGDEWDEGLAQMAEALATSPEGFERTRLLGITALLIAARGELTVDALRAAEAAAAGVRDPQIDGTLAMVREEVALNSGRFSEVHAHFLAAVDAWHEFMASAGPTAALAALLARRPDEARDTLGAAVAYKSGAAGPEILRGWLRAGVAALEGNLGAAAAGFRESIAAARTSGWELQGAFAGIAAAALLPGEPEVSEWTDWSRSVFERVHATGYLALLDDQLKSGGTRPAAASQATTEATPARAT
jgi:class 3 adenylate cyclase/tetratricopeptide (TPR) repeat protein